MELLKNSLKPIEHLTGLLKGTTQQSLSGSTGCPVVKECSTCNPFCCHPAIEVQNFIVKNAVSTYWSATESAALLGLAIAATTVAGPIGALLVGIYELLKPLANWMNVSLNKSRMQETQVKMIALEQNAMAYQLQGFLQCRIGWCRTLDIFSTERRFSQNSGIFGDQGPKMMQGLITAYILAANQLNNDRFGRSTQTIIDGEPSYDQSLPDQEIDPRRLCIRVPNIEYYWQHDIILVPNPDGSMMELYVKHRYGFSKDYTPDCDQTFLHQTIIPTGIYDGDRGCQMGLTTGYIGLARSMGSANSGMNIRNLSGEGLLMTQISYDDCSAAFINNLKGKKVSLKNQVYIVMDTTTPTPTPVPTPTPTPIIPTPVKTNSLTLPSTLLKNTTIASIGTGIFQFLLIGIGINFLYDAFFDDKIKRKNNPEPEKQ